MKEKLSLLKSFFRPARQLNKYQLFTLFVLFWLGLAWLALVMALLGIFYVSLLLIYFACGIFLTAGVLWLNRPALQCNRRFFLILAISLISIGIFSFYSTPTIFSGRDQGSLSEAAIRLAQNNKLEFSFPAEKQFFRIYGPGTALNFPGFNYTADGSLITQFPLEYISWLAAFYALFGLSGLILANAVTFFIFLFSFYLTARYFLRSSSALMAFLLVVTSFIFSWFFKFTLSENLALGFLWFGIFEFVLFTQHKINVAESENKNFHGRFYLLASLLSLGLLAFARVEALAFLAVVVGILLVKYKDWKYLLFVVIGKKMLLVLGAVVLMYFFNLAIDAQAYRSIIKGLIGPFLSLKGSLPVSGGFFAPILYIFRVFAAYGLLLYILLGIIGFLYLLRRKKFEILVPFLIVLPNFIYLLYPSISADHPWMLRRFVFGIVPICIFYAVWFLDRFFRRRAYFYLITGAFLVLNLVVFLPYLAVSPDRNLLPQVQALGNNFSGNDLVLVDRLATGDGWSMLAGPLNFLYGKQAVYFFNPNDLAKLDLSGFQKVYLIVPDNDLDLYQAGGLLAHMQPVNDYELTTANLDAPAVSKTDAYAAPVTLPALQNIVTDGKIYLYLESN